MNLKLHRIYVYITNSKRSITLNKSILKIKISKLRRKYEGKFLNSKRFIFLLKSHLKIQNFKN